MKWLTGHEFWDNFNETRKIEPASTAGTERKRAQEAKDAIEEIKQSQPEMQTDDINKLMPDQEQLFSKKEQQQMKEMAKSQKQLGSVLNNSSSNFPSSHRSYQWWRSQCRCWTADKP